MRVFLELSSDLGAVADEARAAERSGFDGVAVGEHLFFHGPVPNPFVALAAAAGATSRIRLMSALAVVPLYPPAVAVKLAACLDVVSGGRFDFGVGLGGEFPAEFEAAGVDVRHRSRRLRETIELLRELSSGDPVTFEGEFVTVPGLALQPPPVQPGGPPVWMGGRKDAAMARAGRLADVWLPYMYTADQLARSLGRVGDAAEEAGRDRAAVEGAIYCWGFVHEDPAAARAQAIETVSEVYQQDFTPLADRYLLHGDPDLVLKKLEEYREAGARTLVLSVAGDRRAREESVELFRTTVLPALQGTAK